MRREKLTERDKNILEDEYGRMLDLALERMEKPKPREVELSFGRVLLKMYGDVVYQGEVIWNIQENV